MGILGKLFGSSGPSPRQVASAVGALLMRHGEPVRRYEAADRLAAWRTTEAIDGLLRRFSVAAASETSDDEEKAYVAELIEKMGRDAIPSIERYLRREADVAWPLRILGKLCSPDELRDRVLAALATYDAHFDPNPERKVETIHVLVPHAAHEAVAEAVARFLEDTDDTVRIAAVELLSTAGRDVDHHRLVDALVASPDRPRVKSAIARVLADKGLSVPGRKAEVEPLLPQGYYLTREGGVKRLGK
jgi:hypothetical protein